MEDTGAKVGEDNFAAEAAGMVKEALSRIFRRASQRSLLRSSLEAWNRPTFPRLIDADETQVDPSHQPASFARSAAVWNRCESVRAFILRMTAAR